MTGDDTEHCCPECGYELFDNDEEFRSGGGIAVDHYVDDGAFIEEHSCPRCGTVLAQNIDYPDVPGTPWGDRGV